jgi:hypothetical protein
MFIMKVTTRLSIRRLLLSAMALCALLIVTKPSEAATANVTFLFTGSVLNVPDVLHAPTGSLGAGPMTGSITFDSTITPVPTTGIYLGTVSTPVVVPTTFLTIPVKGGGTYTASWDSGGNNFIVIGNSTPGGGDDTFFATSNMDGPTVNGYYPIRWDMSLIDSDGSVFGSTALPLTPPDLSSFSRGEWRLVFGGVNGEQIVSGAFSTLTAVPLPPAVLLFGAGVVALIGLGARNWRLKGSSVA